MDEEGKQIIQDMQEGWSLLFNWGKVIAMLPIEAWLESLERADTTAPILDPTLYRDYLYSGKGPIIKTMLRGALEFKRAILQCQKDTLELEAKNARTDGSRKQSSKPRI